MPDQYTVTLTVTDTAGGEMSATVHAFDALGFEDLNYVPGADVKDLSVGQDFLWIGAKDGAYQADLTNPGAGAYPSVNDGYNGDSIATDVRAVHESGGYVWFGAEQAPGIAYRLDLTANNILAIALPDPSAKVNDISSGATGVWCASDKDVALSTNLSTFAVGRGDASDAVWEGATGAWSAKDSLFPLPAGDAFQVFTPGNDKTKGLADDGDLLWLASDANGVASVSAAGEVQSLYTTADNLSDDKARSITVDATGDIWVATMVGASRFKKDRKVWVPMQDSAGLVSRKDLKAIAIDEQNGRRAIYVGGSAGLAVMQLP